MLELLGQLNRDAENEVKQALNQIAVLKEQKAKRAEKLAGLATEYGSGSRAEGRDELMEELELEERKQDNRLAKLSFCFA